MAAYKLFTSKYSTAEHKASVVGKRDPYTIDAEGRFVGSDGFVVPKDFAEFFDRFPAHINNWVRRRTSAYAMSVEAKEDLCSDLLLHMMTVPENSIYSVPGANGLTDGCKDRIQMFNPERIYGVTSNRFFWFVNGCLRNRFISNIKKNNHDPLELLNDLNSFTLGDDNDHASMPLEDVMVQMSSDEFYTQTGANTLRVEGATMEEQQLYVDEFRAYMREHGPELLPVLDAMENHRSFLEARKFLGVDERMFTRSRNRIKTMLTCFNNSVELPKQRRVYAERRAVTA